MLRDASRVRVNQLVERRQSVGVRSRGEVVVKKRSVVAILVAISVGLACSAATKTFTNTTAQTAPGIVVTFSQEVRVTSYASDVFPTQSPASGESESFTFSGGTLPAGGAFQITWAPSSARVRSTKWITSGSAAVATASLPSIPTTYEEIMAQIAHYPGPDEPLYVPAEGEAIWLTDLDGHADIYDNDSIRINYAPGFDKSQVTKIEVYRDGIKMRFLPEKLDVLTNEQMKTFDGTPAERAPKSSHTDHAIFGYEYGARFYTAASSAPYQVRVVTVKSPVRAPGETFVAIQCPVYTLDGCSDSQMLATFQQWKREGYVGIQFSNYYYMDSVASTHLFAQYDYDEAILPPWDRTATADEVRQWLSVCREAGLKAELRIEIWLTNAAAAQGGWRGNIAPANWKEWFANYTAICVDEARVAEEEGCAIFTPLVELNSAMKQTEYVKQLLDAVSGVYTGRLCISWCTSQSVPLTGSESDWNRYWQQEAGRFWDWTGRNGPLEIGIEWWGLPSSAARSLEIQKDQRLSIVAANFTNFNARLVNYLRATYPQCPVRFCEMGAYNADGSLMPGFVREANPRGQEFDFQEFADTWATFLLAAAWLRTEVVTWTRTMDAGFVRGWPPGQWYLNGTPAARIIGAFLLH